MNKKIAIFAIFALLLAVNTSSQQESESEIYTLTIDYHNEDIQILNIELSRGYSPQFNSEEWSVCAISKNSEKVCIGFRNPSLLLTDGKDKKDNMIGSRESIGETVFRVVIPHFKDAETVTVTHKTPEKTEEVASIDVKDIQFSPPKPLYSIRKKLSFFSFSSFIICSLVLSLFYAIRLIKNSE